MDADTVIDPDAAERAGAGSTTASQAVTGHAAGQVGVGPVDVGQDTGDDADAEINADAAADADAGAGQGTTPLLAVDGFRGPLHRLLALARAQQVDLTRVALPALVDQLAAALQQAGPPLGQKGDWVVMAAWLLLLRSQLLRPVDTPGQQAAASAADRLRDRLLGLQSAQQLAAWLEARPQLGRHCFGRGQPEPLGTLVTAAAQVDVIEFLWASLALFDDDLPATDTTPPLGPRWLDLHDVAAACRRILHRLGEMPEGQPLDRLLPPPRATSQTIAADAGVLDRAAPASIAAENTLRRCSAWTSTFVASLELAKQGAVSLAQQGAFTPIQVRLTEHVVPLPA